MMANLESRFMPTASPGALEFRAHWVRQLRQWFWDEGFIEVETPVLSHDTVIDRHLDPISFPEERVLLANDQTASTDSQRAVYLQTSPEFGMKRILATGLPAIFQITKAFRAQERGQWHNPEFTMAEWYCLRDNYARGIQRLERLAKHLFPQTRQQSIRIATYRELFLEAAEVDPFEPDDQKFASQVLCVVKDSAGAAELIGDRQWALDLVFDARVHAHLATQGAVIVIDYPADQSALAQVASRGEFDVAERFELFVDGIELANGYHELLDPEELLRRNRANNELRQRDGKPPLPGESRLLHAMRSGLAPCAGVALGVDRAVAVACGATQLDHVLAFPWEIA